MPPTNGKFSKIFDLTDRVALITGGSVGFGRVISSGLAEYGCNVAVADLSTKMPELSHQKSLLQAARDRNRRRCE